MNSDTFKTDDSGEQISFIGMCEKIYRGALKAIDIDSRELIENGQEMAGLSLFNENLSTIYQLHSTLESLYTLIYKNQNILNAYGSKRLAQLGRPLKKIFALLTNFNTSYEEKEEFVLQGLGVLGFKKQHQFINDRYLNELEYMLQVLSFLIEDDWIPLSSIEDGDEDESTDRNIPTSVKMYVWQRDGGKCVQCKSQEKLEYDHIIPVSKGGSNTERNIQLLCENCNRKKGATIQ